MEASTTYDAAGLLSAQAWARQQLQGWGVRGPHVDRWLRRGTELLGTDRTARVVLCFDPGDRLLSVDVWCDGRLVFGMDDLV